ncbi:catalytic phage domain protein : Uncharacterized protein OS=Rhodopirellula sp. SWK7 GN=RRSWK_05083 PE=4 SV=1: Phage_integrase [Gemmataceae bacterium]|nr:catalytic phage domain protein : Uncharacterized protein OS=Rhodopirellula sp. SWK7 GN=RRSWK_05083 PE=4 SV=1: Phage_integrase [Gemmataceae bacterium]VTT98879.1 catalytic phage domain protein : Uncharacterized protein OS=Rhodopirellula sp. SWK7 GN=RRSWK_05083 PE=4 SV=1: Phage_integrase [Gemmataceae bacterium]
MFPGTFNSPESVAAYKRFVAEFAVSPVSAAPIKGEVTIDYVLAAYLDRARQEYLSDGQPTDEIRHIETVIRAVHEVYGTTPAERFGPRELKAVRQTFIARRWCRKTVNAQTNRVRRIFKWAVSEEMVPPSVYHGLQCVDGLGVGSKEARDHDPVRPVDTQTIAATLPYLNRHVAGLIRFMSYTGCRPSEAARVRRTDIDMKEDTWEYRPPRHKTAWKGGKRVILIGPKGQELLRGFFTPDADDYLFSPIHATEECRALRAAGRKTPRYPSHMKRNQEKRVTKRKRTPTGFYRRQAILTAVARACDRAFPAPAPFGRMPGETVRAWRARMSDADRAAFARWRREHRWHPYQIRHTFATDVAREHDIEAAGIVLGHAKLDVTQFYVEKDMKKARAIIAAIG